MTVILKFWLCAIGTICTPESAGSFQGTKYSFELPMHNTSINQCDEVDAITNDKYLDIFISAGVVPRHSCEIAGGDDL